jgi:hypothetical protein
MGNWIPNDPTLVAQILKISAAYTAPPPEGFVSPMTWGVDTNVIAQFARAGIAEENVSLIRDTYTFNFPGAPTGLVNVFRNYYGPTMNAFEAAEKNGRADDLSEELNALFASQNTTRRDDQTSIPATFLRVTATVKYAKFPPESLANPISVGGKGLFEVVPRSRYPLRYDKRRPET